MTYQTKRKIIMIKTDNLVVLKDSKTLTWQDDTLIPNKVYRCCTPTENGNDNYLIYGYWFTKAEFDLYFEFAYDRVIREWDSIGLIPNGKVLNFKDFKERVDLHTYGKNINHLRIGYVGRLPQGLYSFYPRNCEVRAKQLRCMYSSYVGVVFQNMDAFDNGWIQFNSRGIKISYR